MGFFSKLFGSGTQSGEAPPATPQAAAPRASEGIGHDPKLIESLLKDHARLGALYGELGRAVEARKYDEARRILNQLKSGIQAHVLTENVRLYSYLEQSMRGDEASSEIFRSFRLEMNDIVRKLLAFVTKYQDPNLPESTWHEFTHDYAVVREVLEHRLDSEETRLYPMYHGT